jgi:2,3-bisphosphoglycerate-dependent phosphoglycerate mutase
MSKLPNLILLRHGESEWNLENRFTGWADVSLTGEGIKEAQRAGQLLQEHGIKLDVVYTSVLKRSLASVFHVLSELDRLWLPVEKSWRLNEKHYGALEGLNKAETAEKYGEEQVNLWRRAYDVKPPPMEETDLRHPIHDPRYASVPKGLLPSGESLQDTTERVLRLWQQDISVSIRQRKCVMVLAHGNSLRALIKLIENKTGDEIMGVTVPTGWPLLYDLDQNMQAKAGRYLGDPESVQKAIEKVVGQGSADPKAKQ